MHRTEAGVQSLGECINSSANMGGTGQLALRVFDHGSIFALTKPSRKIHFLELIF